MARDYARRNSRKNQERGGSSSISWVFAGVLIGLFVIVLVYLKTQGGRVLSAQMADQTQEGKPKKKPTTTETPAKPKVPQPKFDFYNMLPQDATTASAKPTAAPTKPQSIAAQIPEPTAPVQTTNENVASSAPANPVDNPQPIATTTNTPVPEQTIAAETKQHLEQEIAQAAANETTPTNKKPAITPSSYMLVIASFKDRTTADQFRAKLLLEGFMPRIKMVQTSTGENLYRVWLGPFAKPSEAKALKAQLKANKVHSLLVKSG